MKPSAVRLRSDRNWIRSWFPSEKTGLLGRTGKQTAGNQRGTLRKDVLVKIETESPTLGGCLHRIFRFSSRR